MPNVDSIVELGRVEMGEKRDEGHVWLEMIW